MCIIMVSRNCQTEETKLVLACYCDHCSQIDLGLRVTGIGASRLQFTATAVIRDLAYLVDLPFSYVLVWKYANEPEFCKSSYVLSKLSTNLIRPSLASLHEYNFNCLFYDNPPICFKNEILDNILFSYVFHNVHNHGFEELPDRRN